jgi:23S rRNA (guanosine2251-2'-O)-methyltransferase
MVSSSAPAHLLASAKMAGIEMERITSAELDMLSGGGVHQGVAALVDGFSYAQFSDLLEISESAASNVLVFLDRITDPHNLGAVARSAFLLGARGVVIPLHDSAHVTPGAMKASAGALAHFPVARVSNLKNALLEAKKMGWFTVGAAGESATEISNIDLRRPLVLVIGSEHLGLRPGVAAACDALARIPMTSVAVGSYNASVAAALCLYEAFRQNRG